MELWPGAWTALLLLLLLLLSTLWFCSSSAKYFFKMAFYNGWILFLAILAIPVCAVRGRNVENMKILRLLLLHVKYLYGIRVEVRGAHHFPPTQPYVVVSNHQSSIVMSSYQDFYSKKERRFTSPGRCQVRVLPPVSTEGLTPDDVPALADSVRHSMLTIFREISTDGLGGGDCLKKPGGAGEARL